MNRTIETILRAAACLTAVVIASIVFFQHVRLRTLRWIGRSRPPRRATSWSGWINLDAAKVSERSAAEKALIEAGLDALPYLPESRAGFSIEATERLSE